MKQTYITPVLKVVKIQTTQMLANSLPVQSGSATEWGSREFDYDDYEDEEEY